MADRRGMPGGGRARNTEPKECFRDVFNRVGLFLFSGFALKT